MATLKGGSTIDGHLILISLMTGADKGIDADLLDSIDSSQLLRTDANSTLLPNAFFSNIMYGEAHLFIDHSNGGKIIIGTTIS